MLWQIWYLVYAHCPILMFHIGLSWKPAFTSTQTQLSVVILQITLLWQLLCLNSFPQAACSSRLTITPIICCANKIISTVNSPHSNYILQNKLHIKPHL